LILGRILECFLLKTFSIFRDSKSEFRKRAFLKRLFIYISSCGNVHHKNWIRDDNRIENLELWASPQPYGQRANDLVAFARQVLATYGEAFPE
jgi:hypothetical protein